VRTNERAAAAVGVDVARTKLLAFGISAALAGLAGCMLSFQAMSISEANWVVLAGMSVLAFAYLGGISSVNGAIVGGMMSTAGLVSYFFRFHFPGFGEYFVILGGVGLVLTAIVHPEGIAPYFQPRMRALGNALVGRWVRPRGGGGEPPPSSEPVVAGPAEVRPAPVPAGEAQR
jgi:branched-chain amino acid transport system permease protein